MPISAAPILTEATFARARLAGAKIVGADLTKAMFDRANMQGADFSNSILIKTELHRANLTKARFTGATMHKAEFGRAILAEADFTDGHMHAAYLARADLRGAIFAGADIGDADFTAPICAAPIFRKRSNSNRNSSTPPAAMKPPNCRRPDPAAGMALRQRRGRGGVTSQRGHYSLSHPNSPAFLRSFY